MRLNKYVALAAGVSRRQADELIESGQITLNGQPARLGQAVAENDTVNWNERPLQAAQLVYLALHKPAGYVCSRNGQGAPTIYDLLPERYRQLKSVGRLDKDTSGLIMLSNDGDWAQRLTHPKYAKPKVYEVELDRPLTDVDQGRLADGVKLPDGLSRFEFISSQPLTIRLSQGRNRQVRRTFEAIGYRVRKLHRSQFGPYALETLKSGEFKEVEKL